MRNKIIVGCLLLLIISCSREKKSNIPSKYSKIENLTSYSANNKGYYDIDLEVVHVVGSQKEKIIDEIVDIGIGNNGRVFIADGGQSNIKVYNANGNFEDVISREGKGPGEFSALRSIKIRGSMLFAWDIKQKKIEVFSVDSLEHKGTIKIGTNKNSVEHIQNARFSNYDLFENSSHFLVKYYDISYPHGKQKWVNSIVTGHYYKMNRKGKIISDRLFEMKSGTYTFIPRGQLVVDGPTGLYPSSLIAVSGDDNIYASRSEDFLIKIYSQKGKYLRSFYYPHEKIEMDVESVKAEGISNLVTDNMKYFDYPKYWPVIDNLLIDDNNRVWVSTIISNHDKRKWYVLTDKGELLSTFNWSSDNDIQEIKDNYVYSKETDKKTGIDKIVKYNFNLSK